MDITAEAKDELRNALIPGAALPTLLNVDRWVANSLLQKAIRRGEVEIAQRAALSFLKDQGSALWRRLVIIAFEDIGIGLPDAIVKTVVASTDARWRRQIGDDSLIACHLVRLLAEAPKSRSTEHLITAAWHHPSFELHRRLVSNSGFSTNLDTISAPSRDFVLRAISAWRASGIGWKWERSGETRLSELLAVFQELAVPEALVTATAIAALRIRDPIILMAPMVWLAVRSSSSSSISHFDMPHTSYSNDVPMYALDKHTRMGREAIRNFAKSDLEVQDCLARFVAPSHRRDACYMAAFYADAAPLAQKLVWDGGDDLERLGTEADLFKVGVPLDGMAPLLGLFRAKVEQLNRCRVETFLEKGQRVEAADGTSNVEGQP
jgi:hypothetical protein